MARNYDYFPGNSILHRTHAVVKLAVMIVLLVAVFITPNVMVLTVYVSSLLALAVVSGIPFRFFKPLLKFLPFMLLFLVGAQAAFYTGNMTPMFDPIDLGFRTDWGRNLDAADVNLFTLYWEGLWFGVLLGLRMLGMFIIFPMVLLTSPPQELVAGLTEVGLPFSIAFIFTTAFRFVPLLFENRRVIQQASMLRGIEGQRGGLIRRAKGFVTTIVPLITSSLRRTNDLEIAIESRAFGAFPTRTHYRSRTFGSAEKQQMILASVIIMGVAVLLRFLMPERLL
jgi:energy-coupling factor transport system permease protein